MPRWDDTWCVLHDVRDAEGVAQEVLLEPRRARTPPAAALHEAPARLRVLLALNVEEACP